MGPGFQLRTLKSALLEGNLVRGLKPEEAIAALVDVSFTVARGEAFGFIGSNGSGKSTLLKLVAGILRPDAGRVLVDGRVAALIELGAGFHPEISGRENVYINGAVLGLSRREVDARFDRIVEFSGLADFIDEPVKTYSSGMYVRLGFAVAIHTEPDVLLVDEVLAVGDEAFAHRCLRKIEELLAGGRTLLLVSHSLALMEGVCDRVLWLDRGVARMVGEPRRVADAYREAVAEEEGRRHLEEKTRQDEKTKQERGEEQAARTGGEEGAVAAAETPRRWGSRQAEIVGVRLLAGGEERYHLRSGEAVAVELQVEAREPLDDFVFGIALSTPRGLEVWGTNTALEGYQPRRLEGTVRVRVDCPELLLAAGEYVLDAAVHARDGAPYDYRKQVLSFSVTAPTAEIGVYRPRHGWHFEGAIVWGAAE
ncbi:MAG TPA: ABC transporter ATP-binding protein [Thermoanaerobaculia bacterium]|jgi:ABC-type polysaccharide/polyol phosphate transport system ATPase subunit|nr:ABC transporter ATP-binding protein [Thermoanaerobaculia bacterium]